MNEQIVKGKWQEFKGEVRKRWGDLTDNELDQTHGNVTAIGGLLSQKYGHLKDDIKAHFDSLVEKYGSQASDSTEQAKENLRANVNSDKNFDRH
jgi:uncharacterized protein YjbJ (UPF0337 family)